MALFVPSMNSWSIWDHSICPSYAFHQSCIFSCESADLSFANKRSISELIQLLLNWTSIIDPIISLIDLSSEHFIIITDFCKTCLQSSNILFKLKDVDIACGRIDLVCRLRILTMYRWNGNIKSILFNFNISCCQISDFSQEFNILSFEFWILSFLNC